MRRVMTVVMLMMFRGRCVCAQRVEDQCTARVAGAQVKRRAAGERRRHMPRGHNTHRQQIGHNGEQGKSPARCCWLSVKGCHGTGGCAVLSKKGQ